MTDYNLFIVEGVMGRGGVLTLFLHLMQCLWETGQHSLVLRVLDNLEALTLQPTLWPEGDSPCS